MFVYSPGGMLGRADLVAVLEQLGRLAEVEAGVERGRVGGLRPARSSNRSSIQSSVGWIGREYSQRHQPEREEVLGALGVAGLTPSGSVATLVSDVIGTLITR